MTVAVRYPLVIAAPAALAPRCLPLLLVVLFGMGGPAFSQERDPRLLRDQLQAAPEPRRDILILRAGGYEEGELTGCSSESCSLGGKSHRRDEIALIGLGITGGDPAPTIDDPLQDSVHLRNATVLKTKLLGINTQTVVSSRGSNPRREVVWVYLAPPSPEPGRSDQSRRPITPSRTDTDGERPTYLWEGRIEVDNVFAGRTIAVDVHGRHKWRGVYQIKFLEKWIRDASSVTGVSGQSFRQTEIVPLEMNYTIQADHHADYDNRWGDVVLHGVAAGKLTGDPLRDTLGGSILRFEAPTSASDSARPAQPRPFASLQEFHNFVGRFHTDRRPGCYQLSIAFGGKGQPPKELRALYRGIDRTGSSPIHPDPDADFLRVMPAYMPDGTNVYGCLEGPEQREVKGELVFPSCDCQPGWSSPQISIKWSFVRSVCRDASTCTTSPR